MQNNLILYTYFRSSTAYRVRIALNLKGLKYEQRAIPLLEGAQHSQTYRELNPFGGVPTLVHENRAISQSFAVIEYLDEVFPQTQLLPVSHFDRAKVRQICENINCDIHPYANLKTLQYLKAEMGLAQDMADKWAKHWISQGMEALEKIVATTSGRFAYGNQITCADVFIVPQIFSAKRYGIDIEKYPSLLKVQQECSQIEAFVKAHPHNQPDTPADLKGKM